MSLRGVIIFLNQHELVEKMAHPEGFEPPTPRFVVWYSIQLNYGCVHATWSCVEGVCTGGDCYLQLIFFYLICAFKNRH